MRAVRWREPACSGPQAAPYRLLAVRVIDQALRDLTRAGRSSADHESARAFLDGSSMLYHWCEIADLDPARTIAHAKSLLAARVRS